MLEKAIVGMIIETLRSRGAWCVKIHGGAYQSAGLPDIIGCHEGRFFALEVKRPGKHLTPLQALTLSRIASAGGIAARVTGVDEALAALGP